MVSKWILPEIICILMDVGLVVFWSTYILMHSFGETNLKKKKSFFLFFLFFFCLLLFFLEKKKRFLSAIFKTVLVQMVTNRSTRLKNTLTIEISFFESDFYDFLKKKMHFTRNLKIMKKHQLKINVCAYIYLGLVGHNLQSLSSPFRNRKISPMSHTYGFGVKIKKVN